MGQVWTRKEWNDSIMRVNAIITNPPANTDCMAGTAIEPVDPSHIWTKNDIQAVQGALKGICSSISFSAVPDLWNQSIIDEINAALSTAWCGCKPITPPPPESCCQLWQWTLPYTISTYRQDLGPYGTGIGFSSPGGNIHASAEERCAAAIEAFKAVAIAFFAGGGGGRRMPASVTFFPPPMSASSHVANQLSLS